MQSLQSIAVPKPRKTNVPDSTLPYFGIDAGEVVALRELARAVYDYLYKDDSGVDQSILEEKLKAVQQINRKRFSSN